MILEPPLDEPRLTCGRFSMNVHGDEWRISRAKHDGKDLESVRPVCDAWVRW